MVSSYNLPEDQNCYVTLMKQQSENMKSFCQLLGAAQVAMLELAKKFKNIPSIPNEECKINKSEKPAQTGSASKLSNNEQTSKNKHEVESFQPEEHSCCTDVCTQVTCEKDDYFNKKETISNVTTSVAEADLTIAKAYIIADGNVEGNIIGHEVDAVASIESLYDAPSFHKRIGFLGYFVERPHTDYDLASISERTEKSTSSEEESIHDIFNKDQAEPETSEAFGNTLDTNKKYTKKVKPLKDRATEVVINTIISQMNNKDREQIKSDEGNKFVVCECENSEGVQQLEPTKDIQTDMSLKSKLSIQMMPSIDIRRGLVTQTIPTIVITPSESIPQQNVVQDSNVGYEIVRHVSNEPVEPINIKPQTHSGEQINKIRSKTSSKIEKKKYADDMEELSPLIDQTREVESYHTEYFNRDFHEVSVDTLEVSPSTSEKVQEFTDDGTERKASPLIPSFHSKNFKRDFPGASSDRLGSARSSVSTCAHVMFNKTGPQNLSDDAFVQATVKLDMPVTTFVNTCFKTESDSEILLENEDLQIPNSDSSTTKKSTIADFFGKKEGAKEFVNEMIKDPQTEVIFKSYQVLQEQSGHEPDEQTDATHLSSMDTDVYKTFVNPDGFKEHRQPEARASPDVGPFLSLSVATPPEFYATKSTQCDEIIGSIPEEANDEPEQITADDNVSQNTQMDSDSTSHTNTLFKNFDTQTMLSYKPETSHLLDARAVVQDPSYISRTPTMFRESIVPHVSSGHSHSNVPRDIQKRLASSSSTMRNLGTRNSLNQKPSALLTGHPLKRSSEHTVKLLKSSHSLRSLNLIEADNVSVKSETTEDVILQINRETLRSVSHYSKLELDQGSDFNLRKQDGYSFRKDSANSRVEEVQSGDSSVTTSEYVITHDVSLQTSLDGVSEADLILHHFSKESVGSIEKLRVIVEQDTRSEGDVNTFLCCSKLLGTKKRTPEDVYVKSTADDSLLLSEIEQANIKMDMPEAGPLYKQHPVGVCPVPENPVVTPVASFIEGLTSHNKNEIIIARNAPPRNELSVLEEHDPTEIIHAIKQNTESWKELDRLRLSDSKTVDKTSQTSTQGLRMRLQEIAADRLHEEDKPQTENNNLDGPERKNNNHSESNSVDSSILAAYTILSVNVEHSGLTEDQLYSTKNDEATKSTNVSSPQRSAPGGDDGNSEESTARFYPTRAKHEGIFPRHHKHRQKQVRRINESSSSSEPTTPWGSISEKADGNLSEGEIKCKCSASIGEIHECPCGKKQRPIQYLKRTPRNLLKHEFGNSNVKIKWQKEFNSNWVAYYVSRSPSPEPDNTESIDKSSTDSSGIIRK